jgi:hydrogenase 3 maturation protease
MSALADDLQKILVDRTCIVGVGNMLRNDDAIGAIVANRLQQEISPASQLSVVNVEDVIENHVFRIAENDARNILVIDAVQWAGAEPGSLVLGRMEDLETSGGGYSTHKLALSTAAIVLRHHGKEVYLLGIAAANTDFGRQVSQDVLDGGEAVIAMVRENCRSE